MCLVVVVCSWQQQSHFTTCILHAEHHCRITAGLFIGAGCQNNTSVSACLPACMHACFPAKTETHRMERTLSWSESSPATTHTHTYCRLTHTPPKSSYTISCSGWLYTNASRIYLRLLLLILEHIFPFRPQSVAVIVKVINDRYLHVLRLHLSRSAWGSLPPPEIVHAGPARELRLHRTRRSTDSGAPSWGSPPPPPPWGRGYKVIVTAERSTSWSHEYKPTWC